MKGSYWIVNTNYGAFLTNKKDFIGNKLFYEHTWEPEIIQIYEQLLKSNYNVVDMGAHMGFHTINFANKVKHVYAFEPQLSLYNQIRGNVFLNELNEKVTCFNVGLGEKNKRSSFGSLDKHNSLNWGAEWEIELINYGGRALEDNLNSKEIEIKTLDSFNLEPDFIKIDVEGYELKALQGAKNTLKNNFPILMFEAFLENQEKVFGFLKKIGYEIYSIPFNTCKEDFVGLHPDFKDYSEILNKMDFLNKI
jgi:FkbM family methyltransferase